MNKNDISIIGVIKNKRTWRYILQEYIDLIYKNLLKYEIIPKSNNAGAIGKVIPTVLISEPLIAGPRIGLYTHFHFGWCI